jgi:hypothetical protein
MAELQHKAQAAGGVGQGKPQCRRPLTSARATSTPALMACIAPTPSMDARNQPAPLPAAMAASSAPPDAAARLALRPWAVAVRGANSAAAAEGQTRACQMSAAQGTRPLQSQSSLASA